MAQQAGLSDQGFVVKRLQDIITDKKAYAQTVFQDLVPQGQTVDTSDDTILGRLATLESPAEADLWEAAALVYSSFDPEQATGAALDNICAIGGITRLQGAPSSAQMQINGTINSTAPVTFQIGSPVTGNQYTLSQLVQLSPVKVNYFTLSVLTINASTAYTVTFTPSLGGATPLVATYTTDTTPTLTEIQNGLLAAINSTLKYTASLNTDGTLAVTSVDPFSQTDITTTTTNLGIINVGKVVVATCTVNGPSVDAANTINVISTPTFGITSATNLLASTPGQLIETDDQLRNRFRSSKSASAVNTLDSIFAAIEAVAGVTQLFVYENDTSVTDSNGLPSHSFMPVVEGGSSSLIAQAIWSKKPTGIQSYGDTIVTINDSQGLPHSIAFKRPTQVKVYVTVSVTKDSTFPATGQADIQNAVINYLNSLLIGQSVVYSRLYTPINSVQGFQINSMFIGTSPSPTGTSNIPMTITQTAYADNTTVVVNVS